MNTLAPQQDSSKSKRPRLNPEQMEVCHLVRDPGIRPMIWKFHPSKRDEIRRAYLKAGPNQPILDKYPFSSDTSHRRRFQASWFELYPSWLEYSIEDDAVYCLPCYLFAMESSINTDSNAFIENGFRNWKKVNSGKDCPLLNHIGKGPNSFHHRATKSCDDLMKQSQHVDTIMKRQTSEEIKNNRRRLGASIDCIRWLTFQGCAYRGHDESSSSDNRGNFIELLKFLDSYNSSVQNLVLKNAPRFAKYTSSDVQKEILHVLATMLVMNLKKEQMTIVLRFVDVDGFVRDRFFDLVHVSDTSALTLKKELVSVLSIYNLQIENIRGQGLQLALVAASREVLQIPEFFTQLTAIVNIVSASCKRHDQLQEAQEIENAKLVVNDELKTGQGANQMGTLQRAGDTRWSSHFHFVCSLIRMFAATQTVLNNIIDDGTTFVQRAIDSQIQELNSRFNEETMELLTLSTALDPKDNFKLFNIQNICKLAENFYPSNFSDHEMILLNAQLQHYAFNIPNHLKDIGTLSELCQRSKKTEKSRTYHLVDRLIRNVLTLLVSTATTERAFSAIKIVKTRLRSKMADEFLVDNLVIYIEKEIAATFSTDSIIDDFESRKKRRAQLSM
ncbi:uncharacterized protein LOC130950059 [Arachis stenosperma]|uniref:uncharacterized protein LOC130950059 n=1 Tax=Arachis stenosperma TaxID=217475 RepID=UPI0025AC584D|nr:uncharacterized protein LOC130950059 [Arachis stenosperma]